VLRGAAGRCRALQGVAGRCRVMQGVALAAARWLWVVSGKVQVRSGALQGAWGDYNK